MERWMYYSLAGGVSLILANLNQDWWGGWAYLGVATLFLVLMIVDKE